eukprot:TRINITY_DN49783_c0_g1_i2.p1 TRINITY_DN49783_c0_g1~~TRINITY_DN49783_c0_g1_i2.p1  ORF type:complete len:277 (+),score=50.29 TRINITY_DN49783_c0_g1_i2:61-891(+)
MFSAGPVAVVSSASAVAAPTASSSGAAVTSPTEASLRQQHQPWGKEEVDAFIQDLVFDDADFVTEQEARQEAKPPAASNTSGGNVFVTHRPSHIGIVPSASDRASANTGGFSIGGALLGLQFLWGGSACMDACYGEGPISPRESPVQSPRTATWRPGWAGSQEHLIGREGRHMRLRPSREGSLYSSAASVAQGEKWPLPPWVPTDHVGSELGPFKAIPEESGEDDEEEDQEIMETIVVTGLGKGTTTVEGGALGAKYHGLQAVSDPAGVRLQRYIM